MRIVHWNILHGGGSRRMPEITLSLLEHRPDVIVITEYRTTIGGQIRGVLADHGLASQFCTDPAKGKNGVLIAARRSGERIATPRDLPEALHTRWLDVRLPAAGGDVSITGVHVPDDSRPTAKAAFWRRMVDLATNRASELHLFIGDFNTGRHRLDESGATFGCTSLLGAVCTLGYVDAFRHFEPERREWTWSRPRPDRATSGESCTFASSQAGFRIDTALVSGPMVPALRGAKYSHSERETGVSDHSAMIVDLDIPAPGAEKCTESTQKTAIFWSA